MHLDINSSRNLIFANQAIIKPAKLSFSGKQSKVSTPEGNKPFEGLLPDYRTFISDNSPLANAQRKMLYSIRKILLEDLHLQKDQPLFIKADSTYLPFISLMVREAYKMGSGRVEVELVEPQLEKLKAKYNVPEPAWKIRRNQVLENNKAASISFDSVTSPYKLAGLTPGEINLVNSDYKVSIPDHIQKKLEIDPSDIIDGALNLRKGQPLLIKAYREHAPNVARIVEYAYKQGSGPVYVDFIEPAKFNLEDIKLRYAGDKVLQDFPAYMVDRFKTENYDKEIAYLKLIGHDPFEEENLPANKEEKAELKRRSRLERSAKREALHDIREIGDKLILPWTAYYAPTTMTVSASYADIVRQYASKEEGLMKALEKAAEDARFINHHGELKAQTAKLFERSQKINALNLRELHFISIDLLTGRPDSKTNLVVGLSDQAEFTPSRNTTPTGQVYRANVPSEEIFATPLRDKVYGYASATIPKVIDNKLVDGIKLEFKDGKIVNVRADSNAQVLIDDIKNNENADRLGEVSLVAESPVSQLSVGGKSPRIFYLAVPDENFGCHIAIGNAYDCFKGVQDIYREVKEQFGDIGYDNPEALNELQKRLEEHKEINQANKSSTHRDITIGGPNVIVEGKTTAGRVVQLIKDDKFLIDNKDNLEFSNDYNYPLPD